MKDESVDDNRNSFGEGEQEQEEGRLIWEEGLQCGAVSPWRGPVQVLAEIYRLKSFRSARGNALFLIRPH